MSTYRITKIRGVAENATYRLTKIRGVGVEGLTWRITTLRGVGVVTAPANSVYRLTTLRGVQGTQVAPSLTCSHAVAEPFETITLDASGTAGAFNFAYSQTAGTAGTFLPGTGAVRQFKLGANTGGSSETVTIRVDVTGPNGSTFATASLTAYRVNKWRASSGSWVPRAEYRLSA